jgi:hypothetical protein
MTSTFSNIQMGANTSFTSPDLVIGREAANTLRQSNGVNAQTFRLYRTFTDASNYERLALQSSAGNMIIAAESAGTGSANLNLVLTPKGTGQVLTVDGAAGTPAYGFSSATGVGFFNAGSNNIGISLVACSMKLGGGGFINGSTSAFGWTNGTNPTTSSLDTILVRDSAAGIIAQRNGTNSQIFRIYNTFTDASNYERLEIGPQAGGLGAGSIGLIQTQAGTGVARSLFIGVTGSANLNFNTSNSTRWQITSAGHLLASGSDNTFDIGATGATRPRSLYLGAPSVTAAGGTGITVNNSGEVRIQTYKVTMTNAAFSAAATTADVVVATLPAKSKVKSVIAEVTAAFTGSAGTVTLQLGKTTGGAEYIVAFDAKTATVTKGLVDADLGTSINRANAVQGGDIPSWSATTNISARCTSGTGNTSTITAGSVTFYITTEIFP